MSATALLNSEKWSSGEKGRGKLRSPQVFPAARRASSASSLFVRTPAWYLPTEIPCKTFTIINNIIIIVNKFVVNYRCD